MSFQKLFVILSSMTIAPPHTFEHKRFDFFCCRESWSGGEVRDKFRDIPGYTKFH